MSTTAVSRRAFLRNMGLGAAALAAGPGLLGARAQDPVILGSGSHRFEWVAAWAKLPEGLKFGNTHGCCAVDSRNRLFMNTDTPNAVMIFEPDGRFVKSWGQNYAGGAHGMTIVKEDGREALYLAHTGRHEVVKCTLDGDVLLTIPWPEAAGVYENAGQYRPTSVAVAPSGDIYVGDGYGLSWIHQWNAKGEYIRSFGGQGKLKGQVHTPHGVAIDTRGGTPLLLVADRSNARLQSFTLEGKPVAVIREELRLPCHLDIRGDEVLVPDLSGRITLLDRHNKLIAHLGEGSHPRKGRNDYPQNEWQDGVFTAPHCACWDREGNIYVLDWNYAGRISKLKRLA